MNNNIFYSILVISLLINSCLVPGSPQTDWYKPTNINAEKILYKKIKDSLLVDDIFYKFNLKNDVDLYVVIGVGSLPHSKNVGIRLKVVNTSKSIVQFYSDSLKIVSNRIKIDVSKKQKISNIVSIQSNDSIVLNYGQEFKIGDFIWYNKMKKNDTLFLSFKMDNENYNFPFYFNKKNRLETYPFKD